MRLILDSIERSGAQGNDRAAVLRAAFDTSARESVLGTYSIDPNGDTTLTDYGVYTVEDGALAFQQKVTVQLDG